MSSREQRQYAQQLIDHLIVVAIDTMLRSEDADKLTGDIDYAEGRHDMAMEMIDLIKRQAVKYNLRPEGWYRSLTLVVDNTKKSGAGTPL